MLVHNVAKRHNLGTLARSATAFGVTEIILVGRKDFNAFGSHGATLHLQFRHFHTLPEAVKYLKVIVHVARSSVGILLSCGVSHFSPSDLPSLLHVFFEGIIRTILATQLYIHYFHISILGLIVRQFKSSAVNNVVHI